MWFVKGLVNSILTYVPNIIHICPNTKLYEMLSFQKSSSDKTGLGYDFSSLNIASSSTTVFVSPAINVNSENNDVKTVLTSENIDKGKSILRAPLKLDKKETRNLRTKKGNTKSLNRRSSISVITVELQVILDLIAISG